MKKGTKKLAVALCLLLFASMALGSGSSDSKEKKDIAAADNSEAAANPAENDDSSAEAESSSNSTDVTLEEQVLVDQNNIVITAKEYVSDSIWGDGIKVLIENNSDKYVSVGCETLIVNDYMITDLFSASVAAGKKANETIYLSSSELNAAGIDVVGKIELYFHVYDMSSFTTIFDTDCITIQTSEYENMNITPNDAGMELYNEGGIRIVGKTVDENSFWGTAILLYCENTSGVNVGISVDDISVNGFMMSPLFSTTVYDGKKAIDDITILSNDLEENGIESIDEVELKFHIYNADTYETIRDSDSITFSAK